MKGVLALGRSLVFPYPTVQYIPLSLTWIQRFDCNVAKPQILVSRDSGQIQGLWSHFNLIPLELPNRADNEAYVLVLGMTLQDIRYRGFYATILGSSSSTGLLGIVPTQYFYKDPIIFQVREEKGQILAACQFTNSTSTKIKL